MPVTDEEQVVVDGKELSGPGVHGVSDLAPCWLLLAFGWPSPLCWLLRAPPEIVERSLNDNLESCR